MNRTLAVLYDEHEIIKSVISKREKIKSLSVSDPDKFKEILNGLIDFFRNYADMFHHNKEEKLLFPLLCEKNEMLQDSIVEEMLENHREFRDLVKLLETAMVSGNYEQSTEILFKYTEMLLDHIAVEDDELFQMAESLLDKNELEKLYYDFQDIDREIGFDTKHKLEKMPGIIDAVFNLGEEF